MALHPTKRTAILHWFNSLNVSNLSSIKELSNGVSFCEVIHSVFNISFSTNLNTSFKNKIDVLNGSLNNSGIVAKSLSSKHRRHSSRSTPKVECSSPEKHDSLSKENETAMESSLDESTSCVMDRSLDPSQEAEERFKFLESFIDNIFDIESKKLISYPDCIHVNEYELAKVAIFVLTAVVKKFLRTGNEQLNTLTLLDIGVQEDIQECLSLLVQDIWKITEKEIGKVLTRPSRLRVSPRGKNSFCSTPQRNRSSKSPSVTSFKEEIFSDSPLRSFLSSPFIQQQNILLSKEKELSKIRNTLFEEEQKNDDLRKENNSLRKQVEEKGKELRALKARNRNQDTSCSECEEWKDKHKTMLEKISAMKAKHAAEIEELERKIRSYMHEIEVLEEKIQGPYKKCPVGKFEDFPLILRQKDDLLDMEREKIRRLESTIEEMSVNFEKTKMVYEQKLAEANSKKEPEFPVIGECLGNILEVENSALQEELEKKNSEFGNLVKKFEATSVQLECLQDELKKKEKLVDVSCNTSVNLGEVASEVKAKFETIMPTIETEHMNGVCDSLSPKGSLDSTSTKSEEAEKDKARLEHSNKESTLENGCNKLEIGSLWNKTKKRLSNDSITFHHSKHTQTERRDSLWTDFVKTKVQDNVGSLWSNYGKGGSNVDSRVNTKNCPDLSKSVVYNKSELLSKWDAVSEFLNSVDELNTVNELSKSRALSSLETKMKSFEDFMLCLIYIREFLCPILKCKGSSRGSNNGALDCDNYPYYMVLQKNDELQSEVNNLKMEMNRKELNYKVELDTKNSQLKHLSKEMETLKEACKELTKSKDEASKTLKESLEKQALLEKESDSYRKKSLLYRKQCEAVLRENKEYQLKYKKLRKYVIDKRSELNKENRSLESNLEKEKERYKTKSAEVLYIQTMYNCLQQEHAKVVEKLKATYLENSKLKMHLERAFGKEKSKEEKENSTSDVRNSTFEKRAFNEISLNYREGNASTSSSQLHSNAVLQQDVGNESTCSAFGNRSIHNGLILPPTEDEESFVSHSSLQEIYGGTKEERLQEMQRRNTLCPPHLQSTYPTEVQCYSPLDQQTCRRLQDHMKRLQEDAAITEQRKQEWLEQQQLAKKRKMEESEQTSSDVFATPNLPVRKKTPTSLKSLLHFRLRRKIWKSGSEVNYKH